jgi:bifunctional non-homologous end joining protein LigD
VPPAKRLEVEIDGRVLSLSNLEKVMYPQAGFTKGHVVDYYTRIAPALLPHLRGRPLTLKRYPDGVEGQYFYEKQCPSHRPDWVRTAAVWSRHNSRTIDYCLADDLPTLVWLAQLGDLELHTSLALAADVTEPTILAFDLDPGAPATIVECARVALDLREVFDHLGMQAFPKTSGSKGMQVYVPLNVPGVTYDATKGLALALAQLLERRRPELVVSDMRKSLRARERPTVSTPLRWEEVEAVTRSEDPEELAFTSDAVLARVAEHGDLFAPVAVLEQSLPR